MVGLLPGSGSCEQSHYKISWISFSVNVSFSFQLGSLNNVIFISESLISFDEINDILNFFAYSNSSLVQ